MKVRSEVDIALLKAAEDGNIARACDALGQGANVDSTTVRDPIENITALLIASRNGHKDLVQLLINAGANLEKKTRCAIREEASKETALHWAILGEQMSVCRVLLKAGVDIEASSTRGTALTYAVEKGATAIVKLLLGAGAGINSPSGAECRLPLELAAENGRKHILKLLLSAGAKPVPNKLSKRTPLMRACVCGAVACARELIKAGDRVNATDKNLWTPLMWAAWGGSGECTKLLLENGAKPQSKNKEERTALDLARQVDSFEAVYLLERLQQTRSTLGA